jgi:hypothetical protein
MGGEAEALVRFRDQVFLGMVRFYDQEIALQTSEISSNGRVGQPPMTIYMLYMLSREA